MRLARICGASAVSSSLIPSGICGDIQGFGRDHAVPHHHLHHRLAPYLLLHPHASAIASFCHVAVHRRASGVPLLSEEIQGVPGKFELYCEVQR